jgi:hypothetical protein
MLAKTTEWVGGVLLAIFCIVWMFGGIVGAVYWAVEQDILNVVLSMFIPFYGAISVTADLLF